MISVIKYLKKYIGIYVIEFTYFLHCRSQNKGCLSILYFIYKVFLKFFNLTAFNLINHRCYADSHLSSSITILNDNRIGYASNLNFDVERTDFSLIPIELPNVFIASHENVRIQGNSNFVIDSIDNLAISEFGFNMSNRYDNVDAILYRQKENLTILKYGRKNCDRIKKSGIMLSGNFCQNYYHQMYEIMTKLMIVDKAQIPKDIPLIVDEIVFKIETFTQMFESLNKSGRKIETIGPREMIEFGTLYCISSINIIPPHIKLIKNARGEDILFDMNIMINMRECLLSLKSDRLFPKKIFISRKSSNNRKYNEDEVISLVEKSGFSIVAPEEYDLFEQIALFNGAEFIIGATGAAFSNILFCHEGCKIICLQSQRLNISAFTTVAYSLGIDMRYCVGKALNSDLHSEFQVDLTVLELMINNLIEESKKQSI